MHLVVKNTILNLVSKVFPSAQEGRPRANAELILKSIDYVLRTGMSWRQLGEANISPYDYRTVHNTFRRWVKHHIFEAAYRTLLHLEQSKNRRRKHFPEVRRRLFYAIDSTYVKNLYGRDCLGRNPTDRGRKATKMSAIVDEKGLLIAVEYFPGNVSDFRTVKRTLDRKLAPTTPNVPLLADKGYDSSEIRSFIRSQGFVDYVGQRHKRTSRTENSDRAIVENFFAWLDKARRLIMRYETFISTYHSFVMLRCCGLLMKHIT